MAKETHAVAKSREVHRIAKVTLYKTLIRAGCGPEVKPGLYHKRQRKALNQVDVDSLRILSPKA